MRIKTAPSTAQRLALFREACASHFRAERSTSPLARKTPLPSVEQFDGYARQMAERILSEETDRHNNALAEIKRMKELNTP